jgi:hypothetical protein
MSVNILIGHHEPKRQTVRGERGGNIGPIYDTRTVAENERHLVVIGGTANVRWPPARP